LTFCLNSPESDFSKGKIKDKYYIFAPSADLTLQTPIKLYLILRWQNTNLRHMKKTFLLATGIVMLISMGCNHDHFEVPQPANPVVTVCDTSGTISYAATIAPIMATSCTTVGCHDAGSAAGGVNLTTYNGVHKAAVLQSTLVPAVDHKGPNAAPVNWMPLTGSLATCDVNKIIRWVNQGAANN
jgi:hypothetical protein